MSVAEARERQEQRKLKKNNGNSKNGKEDPGQREEMSGKDYRRELKKLHVELVKLQEWVKHKGLKSLHRVRGTRRRRQRRHDQGDHRARQPARVSRHRAAEPRREREKSQMYIQRYLPHLPAAGEIVIFDRSWYNRAGVERVMGFCTEEQARKFLQVAPQVEKAMVESGIILLKYWLEVSPDEQTRRLESRIDDGRKIWKLSPMDLASYSRWYDYSRARDEMFAATDSGWAPWYVVRSDDKQRARLNVHQPPARARFPTKTRRARKSSCPNDRKPGTTRSRTIPSSSLRRSIKCARRGRMCLFRKPNRLIRHALEERAMLAVRQQVLALYVDRPTQQWIVRDPDGKFWVVPPVDNAWDQRQPFNPTGDTDLEPIPGHYKYLLHLPS